MGIVDQKFPRRSGEPESSTKTDGTKGTFREYDVEAIAELIGSMLLEAICEARESGLLANLPLADRCLMVVEEMDGYHGWPHYKDRIKLGSVQ